MADVFDELEYTAPEASDKSKEIAKSLKFYGFEPDPESVEAIRRPLVQKLLYPATEFTSATVGAPGDVLSLLNELIARPTAEFITKKPTQPYEETIFSKILPTSEMVHRKAEEAAGEKIRPESITEELIGTTSGFLGSMVGLGAKGLGKAGQIPFTKIKIPAAINTVLNAFAPAAAFTGAKKADLPPWMTVGATLGTSLLTHRLTNKAVPQIRNDLYKRAGDMSKGQVIYSDKLLDRIDGLYEQLQKGGKTSAKSSVMKFMDNIRAKAIGGGIELDDVIEARKNLFEESKMLTKQQYKPTERYWNQARKVLDDTIKDYKNPEFQKVFREANSLHRGIKESRKMEAWVKGHLKESAIGLGGNFLLRHLQIASGLSPLKAAAATKAYYFTKALVKNPGFRKAYKDVLKNAANENIRGTSRALKNFNEYYTKLDIDKKEVEKDIFDELD